jgi:hypothetical protein
MRNFTLPSEELMGSGHLGCQGCGAALAMRYALKALGDRTIVVIPACCWTIIAGPFPYTSLKVPVLHTAFRDGSRRCFRGARGFRHSGRHRDDRLGLGRRRRDVRYRAAIALRGCRAQREYSLYLLRQRSVHEHGDSAQRRHALPRVDDDDPRKDPKDRTQERYHGDHGRPRHPLRGHGHGRLPR